MTDKNISSSIRASMKFISQLLKARLETSYQGVPFDEARLNTTFINEYPGTPLSNFKIFHNLSDQEFILLLLLLAPHSDSVFIDRQVSEIFSDGHNLPELGGSRGKIHRGVLPTIQTCYFIITGNDTEMNAQVKPIFQPGHLFSNQFIIQVDEPEYGEPFSSCNISMTEEYVELFTTGKVSIPKFSPSFPAERITTPLQWQDLVLNEECDRQLNEVATWIKHRHLIYEKVRSGNNIGRGFKALFYGPSGTGKSLTAALISKNFGIDLFSVDINKILSADTQKAEKIIEKLFYNAETKFWILFFDEFSTISVAKSKAHQPGEEAYTPALSYLWDAIDHFPGLMVFEITDPGKLDDFFLDQFNLKVNFPLPETEQRKILWQIKIPSSYCIDSAVNLDAIAKKYPITGFQIDQVINKIVLSVESRHDNTIMEKDILPILEKLHQAKNKKKELSDEENSIETGLKPGKKEIKIFVSYSSHDREMKDLLINGLKAHLSNKSGITYSFWEDKEIDLGADWEGEINSALKKSKVALLLVSANFSSSKYIVKNELANFFKRKKGDGYLILPVLIRNYNFSDFEKISNLNFFKTYHNEYGFEKPLIRHQLIPFDVLGDDEKTTDKKFEDYYRKLSDYIHHSVSNYYK